MKPVKLRVIAEIEPMDIIHSMDDDEALDFICAIDLAFANVGFTEQLIIRLVESMKNDLSEKEWGVYQKLLDAIKQL